MLSLGYHGLFLDGTFRNDWSSSLPKANNSYFYASGSASAVLTEIFPKLKSKTLSFAKLRGSIARVGNDAGFDRLINSYSYGGLFRNDMAWFQGDAVRKNPNLKPETTISKEIGAEVRLLDGRTLVIRLWSQNFLICPITSVSLSTPVKYPTKVGKSP